MPLEFLCLVDFLEVSIFMNVSLFFTLFNEFDGGLRHEKDILCYIIYLSFFKKKKLLQVT